MTEPPIDDAVTTLRRLDAARFDEPGSIVDLFVVSRSGDAAPHITRALLDPTLAAEFAAATADKASALADLTPRPYGPAAELSRGEVMFTEASVGLLAAIEQEISVGDVPVYDADAEYNDDLRLLVVMVTVAGANPITFYRELRPTAYLGRSRTFAAFWSDGRFNKVTEENTLLFDRRFDAVVAEGFALFTSKNTFERIFDFLVDLQRSASQTFATITTGLRIDGLDEMREACTSHMAMMSKMASIQRRLDADPDYARAMTMDRLIDFVLAHPETDIDLVGSGPGVRLLWLPAPAKRYKILRLLDDDYLMSFLTDRTYEANSKSDPL